MIGRLLTRAWARIRQRARAGARAPVLGLSLGLGLVLPPPAEAAPLKVIASFSILADMVREVGGDRVTVTPLVAPGGDAHVYQPTPSDAKAITAADLVVVNGLGLEGWIDRLIAVSGYKGPILVASHEVATQTVPARVGDRPTGPGMVDPHAWQSLRNGRIYFANIADALSKADPAHAADYAREARRMDGETASLDAWVRDQMAAIPQEKRRIITSHDSFGYFGSAYGITFEAPVGLSTEGEATPAGLGKLIRQIRAEGIKALFIESMADPRLIAQIARETGAVVGGPLYSDTLSPAGGPADGYLKMFRYNVPIMVAAMQRN